MDSIQNQYSDLSATEGLTVLEYSEDFTSFGEAIRMLIVVVAVLIGTLAAMNTITITTFERTREFGTLRALGASSGYLFKLVLVESLSLCLIGGLIGSLLGFVGAMVAENVLLQEIGIDIVSVPWTVPAVTIVIAILVGLVAGIYPAVRVSKQEIVDALRHE
ncbi:MAG: FtsX-like permease family protein [Desulfobacterales bacterium]|nr:FtsX-like permease family protein [Desulfobacterales bacterium]